MEIASQLEVTFIYHHWIPLIRINNKIVVSLSFRILNSISRGKFFFNELDFFY